VPKLERVRKFARAMAKNARVYNTGNPRLFISIRVACWLPQNANFRTMNLRPGIDNSNNQVEGGEQNEGHGF
jgi:hypothetical protein